VITLPGFARTARSRRAILIGAILVCGFLAFWYLATRTSAAGATATLSLVSGDVEVRQRQNTTWTTLSDDLEVEPGDTIRTGADSYAMLTYPDGSTSELQPDTEVVLRKLERQRDGSFFISLHQEIGTTWHRVQRLVDASSRFETTTAAAVAFVRGTTYLVEVDSDQTTEVESAESVVAASAQGVTVEVPEGYRTTIELGKPPTEPRRVVPLESIPSALENSIPSAADNATPVAAASPLLTPTPIPIATPTSIPTPLPAREARLLSLINETRTRQGAPPVSWDPQLAAAAKSHTRDMLEQGFFEYTTPRGKTTPDRLVESGVEGFTRGGLWAGTLTIDNDVDAAHAGDLLTRPGRPANREVLLNPRYTRIGIGIEDREDGRLLITSYFLPPAPTAAD
jgi:uncharacterized protein YkwD